MLLRKYIALLVLSAASGLSWAGEPALDCADGAKTQLDLNVCAGGSLKQADTQLNSVYRAVLAKHRDDAIFLNNLQATQRAWVAWRDAEMKAFYPDRPEGYYGSVFPMCWSGKLAELTRERTKQLQQWLNGVPEGEVCAGSLPRAERK